MAFVAADRVRDTTTTTGTGVITVSGTAPQAYRTFSTVLATSDTLPYFIAHQSANEWETGVGTYSAANQITRTTVTASSNAGAAVSFSAGTKDVVLSPISDPQNIRDVWSRGNATVTTNKPLFDLAQTWNAGGVAFTGLKLNITNTASAAGSLLMDLQVGATSQFSVSKIGDITLSPTAGGTYNQILIVPCGNLVFNTAGSNDFCMNGGASFRAGAGIGIGWSSTSSATASGDLFLFRDAAGILAQRNGANVQTFRVYNTYTDASNYERAVCDWTTTANVLTIGAQAAGTGTLRMTAHVAFQKAGAAVAGDLPSGTFAVVRDTSGSTTKLVYNNAGTLMTVALT